MARTDDSREESFASDDAVEANEDLPGELLAHDLVDPEGYVVSDDETEAEELDAADAVGDAEVDDPTQLDEATSVAAKARSSRPKRRTPDAGPEPTRKGAPTPKRKRATAVATKRTTPAMFVNESVDELKKVVWPTAQQVRQYFVVVLVFVLAIIAYVGLLDFLFGLGLLKLFG